jgi:hypothetical protein
MRVVFSIVAKFSLYLVPFMLLFLNPAINNNAIINMYMIFYALYFVLLALISLIDAVKNIPLVLMKLGGFDMNDEDVNRLYNDLKKESSKIPFIRRLYGRRK